jgi:hypothetical protein
MSAEVPATIQSRLSAFCEQQQIGDNHFGSICTLIYITRRARRHGLPLRPDRLASRHGGQVAGLHQGAVRAILDEYGVTYESLGEAGRTNPSSLSHALAYASFLNQWPDLDRQSLSIIERWWVERLPPRPDAGAFRLHWRRTFSMHWVVADLLAQMNRCAGIDRTATQQKAWIAGMAAALLALPMPASKEQDYPRFEIIHGNGDLQVTCADSVVFVTCFPSSALLDTLRLQLRRRKRTLIVTLDQHTAVINQVLNEANLDQLIEVLSIEQWLAMYVYGYVHGAGDNSAGEQQRRIERVIWQYEHLRESFPSLPKLVLRVRQYKLRDVSGTAQVEST